MEVADRSRFGVTTFGEPEVFDLACAGDPGRKITGRHALGQWRPSEGMLRYLPPDYAVELEYDAGPDGSRRIVPRLRFEGLIVPAAVGGLAIIHDLKGFNPELDRAYRDMFLIHQHVRGSAGTNRRGLTEHFTRQFQYSRDVYVRRWGRTVDNERDVLPDELGTGGHRPSITTLTKLGREAAEKAGYAKTASKHAIRFGLCELAKRHPLVVDPAEVSRLVQLALFDIQPGQSPLSPELMKWVEQRLLEIINNHLDDSREAFNRFFLGADNSLVKQIAQQKRKPGGALPRDEVHRALLQLGLLAYQYVGQCVHTLMRTIKNAFEEPLDDVERLRYEHMYEAQPYYGGLPAALLAERMPFLSCAVVEIWNEPQNQEHVRVLHRMLQYYAAMARKRKEADQLSKKHPPVPQQPISEETSGSHKDEFTGDRVQLRGEEQPAPSRQPAFYEEVFEHIRQLYEIECPGGCSNWDYSLAQKAEDPGTLSLATRCECGQVQKTIEITIDEFKEEADKIRV